jgi:hypothetical protein
MEIEIETEVKIEEKLKTELKNKFQEEKQVAVHCNFKSPPGDIQLIRIWKSTFLIDNSTGHKSKLLYFENISLFPFWTPVEANTNYRFTLIFSALPNDCLFFDLYEEIPQSGGFHVSGIKRNSQDVYKVKIF